MNPFDFTFIFAGISGVIIAALVIAEISLPLRRSILMPILPLVFGVSAFVVTALVQVFFYPPEMPTRLAVLYFGISAVAGVIAAILTLRAIRRAKSA